ncbi:hypothetical protein ACC691_37995, partial [Rhizobium johnstonii]|uniref:hypothetical protein n=1 Tax=Rhizobium johnstonii TaxID=3019933 RepID=UPI003F9B3C55
MIVDEFGGIQSPLIVLAEGDDIAAATHAIDTNLAALDGVKMVMPAELSADGDMARFIVIPDASPKSTPTSRRGSRLIIGSPCGAAMNASSQP